MSLLILFLALASPDPRTPAPADTSALMGGALLPEGTPWDAPGAIRLSDPTAPLAVALLQPTSVRALLLQADGNDVYFVDASEDGASWRTLWRVPPAAPASGLRTRTTTLATPARVRFLRIRPTFGDGMYSVSRLRAYAAAPPPWPPALDYSQPGSQLPAFPWITFVVTGTLRQALGTLALVVLAWGLLARGGGGSRSRAWRRALLGAVAFSSALSWWNFLNFHYHGFVHTWDTYHYYIGAKYFRELGYTGLYECSAVAEADLGFGEEVRGRQMRDLVTNELVPAARALDHPEVCRSRFSAARWTAFVADVSFFREALGRFPWASSQQDHGFNATPVWIAAGSLLANLGPATWSQLGLLTSADVGLLLLMWAFVYLAFGFEPLCAAMIYWGLNSFARYAWTGGAFLRYDWLFWAVAGLCALRRRRPVLAGFAIAYAALLRIFPAAIAVGLLLKALVESGSARSLEPLRRRWRFAAGMALALATLLPLSVAVAGRPAVWREFAQNTRRFLATEAQNFVGLRVALCYRPSLRQQLTLDPLESDPARQWRRDQAEAGRRTRPLLALVGLGFVVLLARTAARNEDWVAALLGLGLLPIFLRLGHYYYSWLLAFGFLAEINPAVGVALAAVAWASNAIADLWPQYDERVVGLSLLVSVFVVGATLLVTPSRRPPPP